MRITKRPKMLRGRTEQGSEYYFLSTPVSAKRRKTPSRAKGDRTPYVRSMVSTKEKLNRFRKSKANE